MAEDPRARLASCVRPSPVPVSPSAASFELETDSHRCRYSRVARPGTPLPRTVRVGAQATSVRGGASTLPRREEERRRQQRRRWRSRATGSTAGAGRASRDRSSRVEPGCSSTRRAHSWSLTRAQHDFFSGEETRGNLFSQSRSESHARKHAENRRYTTTKLGRERERERHRLQIQERY